MAGETCDVCNKGQTLGVAAVPGIPMSVAYCKECLQHDAHPYGIIRANVAMCGGLEHMIEGYGQMGVYYKDKYTTIGEALKEEPLTKEELEPPPDLELEDSE